MLMKENLPPLPHNVEAEQWVLGAIILDNTGLAVAAEILGPDDFFLPANQKIFSAMLRLEREGKGIEDVSLAETLVGDPHVEAVGGPGYISKLADGIPRVTHIEHHCRIIKEKSNSRVSRKTLIPLQVWGNLSSMSLEL